MSGTAYRVPIVGESRCQPAIRKARAGDPVVIVHEKTNRQDPRALRVNDRHGKKLGYIARDSWLQRVLHDEGRMARITIHAIDGRPNLGVVLSVVLLTRSEADEIYAAAQERSAGFGQWLRRLFG